MDWFTCGNVGGIYQAFLDNSTSPFVAGILALTPIDLVNHLILLTFAVLTAIMACTTGNPF